MPQKDGNAVQPAGSPVPGEPVFVVVGKLRRPHGVRGEIIFEVWTDFPERIQPGVTVYIGPKQQAYKLHSVRIHGANLLLSFGDFNTPEEIGLYRNMLVYTAVDQLPPLPEGDYYHHQLIGLRVVTDEKEELGRIIDILETGSNDVLVVRGEIGPELLIPLIDEVVLEIDLAGGFLSVHLLPGLRSE